MNAIRVVLVDDSEEFLQGATSWIRSESDLALAGCTRSGEGALDLADRVEFDLVLMDAAMPGMNGFDATRRFKSRPRPPRVVILTFYDTEVAREAARRAGADGFVSKSEIAERLMPLIRDLFREETEPLEAREAPESARAPAAVVRSNKGRPAAQAGQPESNVPNRNLR